MTKDNNGWDEYKKLILASLESLQREVACLKQVNEKRITEFQIFKSDYERNVAKVKVYLSLGVALGTGVLQVALFYLQQLMVH